MLRPQAGMHRDDGESIPTASFGHFKATKRPNDNSTKRPNDNPSIPRIAVIPGNPHQPVGFDHTGTQAGLGEVVAQQ